MKEIKYRLAKWVCKKLLSLESSKLGRYLGLPGTDEFEGLNRTVRFMDKLERLCENRR
jgi:hypothetical protein